MKKTFKWPLPVQRALRLLGHDISVARRRRCITVQLLAQRAGVSRAVIGKIERGEPTVSMGAWASVIFVLGLIDNLENLASLERDDIAMRLNEEQLPKRVRLPKD